MRNKNLSRKGMAFANIIWEGLLKDYKSHDGDLSDLVKAVQGYRLTTAFKWHNSPAPAKPFSIRGRPPISYQGR